MARSALIPVTAKVLASLEKGLFKVALPNGHVLLGHVSPKKEDVVNRILPGSTVSLELTPRDLSKGRILQVLE